MKESRNGRGCAGRSAFNVAQPGEVTGANSHGSAGAVLPTYRSDDVWPFTP